LIELFSIELTKSVYIWGNEGNGSDQNPYERARWLGKIMAIRAAAKDKVFMYVFRVLFPSSTFLSLSLSRPDRLVLMSLVIRQYSWKL
jgi:hypothetical protein